MYDITLSYAPQRMALIARRRATAETAGAVVAEAFAELFAHIDSGAAYGAEDAIAIFPPDVAEPGEHDIAVAVVIADGVPGPGIELDELPACQVVRTVHRGAFETTSEGWQAIGEWMDERDLEPAGACWEVYRTGPDADETVVELQRPLP